jgi:hypothetical protein
MKKRAYGTAAFALLAASWAQAQSPASSGDPYRDGFQEIAPLASYTAHKAPAAQPAVPGRAPSAAGVRTMPEYRVTDFRMEAFRSRDLLTRSGMQDASFRRHPGLLLGNGLRLNEGLAYATFLTDDWRDTKNDYRDMARAMAAGGDPGEGRMIVAAVDDLDVRLRAEEENAASAPAIGRFQIASAETGTRLLELPEQTIDIPFVRRTW